MTGTGSGGTDGLDDGVLHDALLALLPPAGRSAAAGVPPGALAQLEVHAHPEVLEERVEDLQNRRTWRHNTRINRRPHPRAFEQIAAEPSPSD